MLMVLVVRMRMIVRDGIVNVEVFVMLGDVKPDANRHQARSDKKLSGQRLAEREHGRRGAEERRSREISAGARRSEVAQGQHEKRQAGAVAQHANEAGQRCCTGARQRTAHPQAQDDIAGAGDQALQLDDLERVDERDLAGQVVVQPPGDAGADNRRRADQARQRWPASLACWATAPAWRFLSWPCATS